MGPDSAPVFVHIRLVSHNVHVCSVIRCVFPAPGVTSAPAAVCILSGIVIANNKGVIPIIQTEPSNTFPDAVTPAAPLPLPCFYSKRKQINPSYSIIHRTAYVFFNTHPTPYTATPRSEDFCVVRHIYIFFISLNPQCNSVPPPLHVQKGFPTY